MKADYDREAAQLVLSARRMSGLSQADFARVLEKSQTLVSKYEAGRVSPPASVIMHCMHILRAPQAAPPVPDAHWAAVSVALRDLTTALHSLQSR